MSYPSNLSALLSDSRYQRHNPAQVDVVLRRMNVQPSTVFVDFFKAFRGPFWSDVLGIELADLIEDEQPIESLTQHCRSRFGFPDRVIVLTPLSPGNTVHALDTETDRVYVVDFEGGERLLVLGQLDAGWGAFSEFLVAFFSG